MGIFNVLVSLMQAFSVMLVPVINEQIDVDINNVPTEIGIEQANENWRSFWDANQDIVLMGPEVQPIIEPPVYTSVHPEYVAPELDVNNVPTATGAVQIEDNWDAFWAMNPELRK